MKATLIVVGLLSGCAIGAYAQGTLNWNSQSDWIISVYSPSTATPSVIQTGNSPLDVPAGTTIYSGGWIGGDGTQLGNGVNPTPVSFYGINYQAAWIFEVGLYVDTSAAAVLNDIQSLPPLATTGIQDGAIIPVGTLATVPGIPGGTYVNV